MTENIFPDRDSFIGREYKEKILGQKGLVIWFTGLSGAGKSTLAMGLEKKLIQNNYLTEVLDGDKIRNGLNNNLGFTAEDRIENIRRIAEVSKLFCNCGIVTISAFISPTTEIRQMARQIIEDENFFEVYVSTTLEICESRDTKGLYKKARKGFIQNFTGISAPYEAPQNPNITINTDRKTVDECVENIFQRIEKIISTDNK
jgi:adenylylsulfate kinase